MVSGCWRMTDGQRPLMSGVNVMTLGSNMDDIGTVWRIRARWPFLAPSARLRRARPRTHARRDRQNRAESYKSGQRQLSDAIRLPGGAQILQKLVDARE